MPIKDRGRSILIAILVFSILIIVILIVVSIIIAYLRRDINFPTLNINVVESKQWQSPMEMCDPYNISKGSYRMNFFNSENIFIHTIIISNATNEILKKIIVPQDVPSSQYIYSYILKEPGTYTFENFKGSEKIGQIIFTYPHPCIQKTNE